jgi:hypothetical protein
MTESRMCAREGCTRPLPPGSAPQRRFCGSTCQRRQHRIERLRADAQEQGLDAETATARLRDAVPRVCAQHGCTEPIPAGSAPQRRLCEEHRLLQRNGMLKPRVRKAKERV